MPPSDATEFTDLLNTSEAPASPTRRKRKELSDFGWPAAMKRSTAAAYLDISEHALNREVNAGRIPAPFMLGGRDHWRKDAIDVALARLTGEDVLFNYGRRMPERSPSEVAYDLWKASKK